MTLLALGIEYTFGNFSEFTW